MVGGVSVLCYLKPANAQVLQMRFRKIGLSILLAIGLVLNAIGLGWSNIEGSSRSVTSYALLSLFSLYLFIIAVRAVNQDQQSLHAASILHLTTLLTILTAGFFFLALLPDADAPIPISLRLQLQNTPFPTILWNVTTLLYFVPTVVAYTTRLGPPLHYPPDAIYAGKTVQAITNKDQANVTGIVGTCYRAVPTNIIFIQVQIAHHGPT